MESLLPLKKCCSCSSQLATKIVGSIYLIFGFVGIVLSTMASWPSSNDNSFDNEPITNNTDDTQDSELETGAVWLQSFQFVVSIVTCLFAIGVLIAAWMNSRRWLLLPCLICQPLFTMIGFISTGYYAVWYWRDRDITMGIVYSAACVFIAVIGAICWKVINNYYKELREPDKNNKDSSSEENKPIIPQTDGKKTKNANNDGNVQVKIDNLEFK